MKSYESILLDGEYVECATKQIKEEVERVARGIIKSGSHPENGKRARGLVIASSEPWFVKLVF